MKTFLNKAIIIVAIVYVIIRVPAIHLFSLAKTMEMSGFQNNFMDFKFIICNSSALQILLFSNIFTVDN